MIDGNSLLLLKHIALETKGEKTTNSALAKKMDKSPQTISRRLKELEKNNLISRKVKPDGQKINLSQKGYKKLKKEYNDYKEIFEIQTKKTLKGQVTNGLGEGKYYISQKGYQKQFKDKLGFKAYPGTLNIKLDSESRKKFQEIKQRQGININGFKKGERTFGEAKCFKAYLNDQKCALIIPQRSHYSEEVVEIISPNRLRNKIENEKIEIEVEI